MTVARAPRRSGIGRVVRAGRLALLGLAAWTPAAAGEPAPAQAAAPPGCDTQASEDQVAAILPDGDVRLASGRLAKLMDLRFPDEADLRRAGTSWLGRAQGRAVAVAARPGDRWGRVPARLVLAGEGGGLDLAHGLVEEGLAAVDAGEGTALCGLELLALEATARERGLGLWALPRYKPLAAADLPALRARTGSFALVEGRVLGVGERRRWTYLNFGSDWSTDLTVAIPKRTWDRIRARGVSAEGLRGRRVRARGLLEDRQGPAIEIAAAEMLEVLEPARPEAWRRSVRTMGEAGGEPQGRR